MAADAQFDASGCKSITRYTFCYSYRLVMGITLLMVPGTDNRRNTAAVALGVIFFGLFLIMAREEKLHEKVEKFKLYYYFLLPLECLFLLVAVTHPGSKAPAQGAGGVVLINLTMCFFLRLKTCCNNKQNPCHNDGGCGELWKPGALDD